MNAYREPSPPPGLAIDLKPLPPRGLVRANGSRCCCTPPSFLWCWWYGVRYDDRWFCVHGGEWLRIQNYAHVWFQADWKAVRDRSTTEGDKR